MVICILMLYYITKLETTSSSIADEKIELKESPVASSPNETPTPFDLPNNEIQVSQNCK